jgi:hypothetical protein
MRQVQCFLYPAFQMIYPHWLHCLNLLPHLDTLFDPGPPTCVYGFADASGAGFGSSLQLPSGIISYRYGL